MARKKGMNNKNRKLKKKYIYFFMEGSKNCSEDKYIKEYYGQFQDKAVDIGFRFISCGDGSWKNIEKEINKEKRKLILWSAFFNWGVLDFRWIRYLWILSSWGEDCEANQSLSILLRSVLR